MSRTQTTTMVDGFSRPEGAPGRPKRGIKRPAEPELVLRLQAPKRQCIIERDLVNPSQANDVREQHRFADKLIAINQNIRLAQKLMNFRMGHFGSGHPLVEPVDIPVELPEETKPVVGNTYDKVLAQNWNRALNATLRAGRRLEMLEKEPGYWSYYKMRAEEFASLKPAQQLLRSRRQKRLEAQIKAAEEERKRLSKPPTLAQRQAAKEAAEAERKRLLTTRKPAEEYGIMVRSIAKDRLTVLPDFKRPNWGLKQISAGEFENVAFGAWKKDREFPKDIVFGVQVCKRVLHLGEEPQPITFFQKEFRELRDLLGEVVERHFGGLALDEELQNEKGFKILNKLLYPAKLGSLIDAVYDNDGNLMTVACNPKRRTEVVQGVIVRVLRARVLNSLLFGARDRQLRRIMDEETLLANDKRIEGFARQMKRSCYHQRGASSQQYNKWKWSPQHFLEDVRYVTQEICNMFLRLADVLRVEGAGREPENLGLLPAERTQQLTEEQADVKEYIAIRRRECFADIHNIVHMAAYLAVCVRVHPTPIMIDLRTPGIKSEKELDLKCVNYDEYREAKVQLGMEHILRKDEEAAERKADLANAKRKCGGWFDKGFKTIAKETSAYEYELLEHAWLKGENTLLPYRPPNSMRWREVLEQAVKGPNTTRLALTHEQKVSANSYLAYLRLWDLMKKMGVKKEDMAARKNWLKDAYVEAYCQHFFEDVETKYRRDDDVVECEALIRTAVWPSVTLYQPGDGTVGGEKHGMRSWTITKGEAACHCFLPRDKRKRVYNKHILKAGHLKATLRVGGNDEVDAKKDVKMDPMKGRPVPCEPSDKDVKQAREEVPTAGSLCKRNSTRMA